MENFGILTPGDPNFDLSKKMTEMISKWFFASFRTLRFVFLYGDQEPRSWGGAFKRPPPPAGGGKSRGPAGRGLCDLINVLYRGNVALNICVSFSFCSFVSLITHVACALFSQPPRASRLVVVSIAHISVSFVLAYTSTCPSGVPTSPQFAVATLVDRCCVPRAALA